MQVWIMTEEKGNVTCTQKHKPWLFGHILTAEGVTLDVPCVVV